MGHVAYFEPIPDQDHRDVINFTPAKHGDLLAILKQTALEYLDIKYIKYVDGVATNPKTYHLLEIIDPTDNCHAGAMTKALGIIAHKIISESLSNRSRIDINRISDRLEDFESILRCRHLFRRHFVEWKSGRCETVRELREMARILRAHEKSAHKSRAVSSSIGLVGGGLALAGIALAPATAGASLTITALGLEVGAAGVSLSLTALSLGAGAASSATSTVSSIHNKRMRKQCIRGTRRILGNDQEMTSVLYSESREMCDRLEQLSKELDDLFRKTFDDSGFFGEARDIGTQLWSVLSTLSTVYGAAKFAYELTTSFDKVAAQLTSTNIAGKLATKSTAKYLVGIGMVCDAFELTMASKDLYRETKSDLVRTIEQDIIPCLEKELIKFEELNASF